MSEKGREQADWNRLVYLLLTGNVVSRAEATRARARAYRLVRKGDFTGAWAAVSEQRRGSEDQYWLAPLRRVAACFGGADNLDSGLDECTASEACTNETQHAVRKIAAAASALDLGTDDPIARARRNALNAAFRLEAALCGPTKSDIRVLDALGNVCTLVDNLITASALMLFDCGILPCESIEPSTGRVNFDPDSKKLSGVRNDGYINTSSRTKWFKRFAKQRSDEQRPIAELSGLLDREGSNQSKSRKVTLRSLRNDASHRALSREQIEHAIELGREVGLWQLERELDTGSHALFEGGPVDQALGEIGVTKASQIYRNLVEDGLLALLRYGETKMDDRGDTSP